jgi:competence protein ComEA
MLNDLSKEQQLIILGIVGLIVAGLGVTAFRHFSADNNADIVIPGPVQEKATIGTSTGSVIVHVAGAVQQEGVYKLKFGDRIMDALNLAGGTLASADISSINLAEKVKDGEKITVPYAPASGSPDRACRQAGTRITGYPGNGGSGTSLSKVNLNSAGEKELCKIPGIGPSTAKRIIEYRSVNGPFSKIEDIMKVKGIGKGSFGKIKGKIRI